MNEPVALTFGSPGSGEDVKEIRNDAVRLDEVDALLSDLTAADAVTLSLGDYQERLLRSVIQAARAAGAAVWIYDMASGWRAERSVGILPAATVARAEAMQNAVTSGTTRVTTPASTGAALSAFAPMSGRCLELVVHEPASEPQRRMLAEIARSFAEVGAEDLNRRELESLRIQAVRSRRMEAFTRVVYQSLDLGPTAFAIVNDGRPVVGCDRLSVFQAYGGQVLAVSGVEFPDRRSDVVRHLERLSREVLDAGGRYWRFRGERIESDLGAPPTRLVAAWNGLRETTPEVSADVVVLLRSTEAAAARTPLGVLIAEWIGDAQDATPDRLLPVAIHAEQALHHCIEATPGPVAAALRTFTAPWRRHRIKTALAAVVLTAALLALVLIRVEHTVTARGRLIPAEMRDIFAPADAVVTRLDVRPGEVVAAQTILCTLTDPLLELDQERVVGELETARQRLRAIQAERATRGRITDESARGAAALAADEQELTEQIESLTRQLAILTTQQGLLTVRSPIAGTVLTWEADERLEDRPVRRGQRLMTVADGDGDWLLDLYVPDTSTGHLLAARNAIQPNLAIDYLLATEPRTTFRAVLERVALSTEADMQGAPSLRVAARLPRAEVPAPRPGATVVAKIHCGRRALGYVWFHEFYEAFLTHVWF